MVQSNTHIKKLQSNYLFQKIAQLKNDFLKKNPNVDLINLGIGDTTEPICQSISKAMQKAAFDLGIREKYQGYGPDQGFLELRENISKHFYNSKIDPEDIYISDGAKPDIGRFQAFFGPGKTVALQNPAYPVYIDGSVISGQTGSYIKSEDSYENLTFLPCTKENNYFPDLSKVKKTDLIYFCSPHNPTGAVASHKQLKELVDFAKKNGSIIIFDSAYSAYIQDPNLPKSIYEIDGAQDVAIEVNSFSKSAGFTGVRLGFSIVPKELKFDDGIKVKDQWIRYLATVYNGASLISQYGANAYFSPQGLSESKQTIQYYLNNAKILKEALDEHFETLSSINAPYIWAYAKGQDSWDLFNTFLEKAHIVCVPGIGFGSLGQSCVRFSAFNTLDNILKAKTRITTFKKMPSLVSPGSSL